MWNSIKLYTNTNVVLDYYVCYLIHQNVITRRHKCLMYVYIIIKKTEATQFENVYQSIRKHCPISNRC